MDHAGLVGGDEVLDVDEGVVAAGRLERLQGALDEVAQVLLPVLRVLDPVAQVTCHKENIPI